MVGCGGSNYRRYRKVQEYYPGKISDYDQVNTGADLQ